MTTKNLNEIMENTEPILNAPGYEKLGDVLKRAYDHAAHGKGKERHADDEPFHQQVMLTGAKRFGTGALLFQAFKKSDESQRLPTDAAVRELLGAINYLAGAVIALETKQMVAANDNVPQFTRHEKGFPQPTDTFGKVVEYSVRQPNGSSLFFKGIANNLAWTNTDDSKWISSYRIFPNG